MTKSVPMQEKAYWWYALEIDNKSEKPKSRVIIDTTHNKWYNLLELCDEGEKELEKKYKTSYGQRIKKVLAQGRYYDSDNIKAPDFSGGLTILEVKDIDE